MKKETRARNLSATSKQNKELNYKTSIKTIREHGDLVILGLKGTCKTTLMQNLARELREDSNNHVIIFETSPKWIHEFDSIAYMTIADSDVRLKEEYPYLEGDRAYI